MFALVDCNNFYASCERVFQPGLNGKPVVILSNNDGCVIARSNEAKALGVPMGAPAFQYKQVFEQHDIAVFSSNYALYGDMSGRVMRILSSLAPEAEVYSIDEAFLRFEGCQHMDFYEHSQKMKKTVTKSTGIPISVGMAPTKSLAKVANKIAKKFSEETKGCYVIDNDEKRIKALKWLKIEDVWGVGRRNAIKLQRAGIHTAYAFTKQSDAWVQKHLSVVGLRLKHDLDGSPVLDMEVAIDKKNIATTRSFDYTYSSLDVIKERVSTFAVSCAEKLRKQKSDCNAIMVFLKTNRHHPELPQHHQQIVIPLPYATNSAITLSQFATRAVQQLFKEGYKYKKAGVIVMDITPSDYTQTTLFEQPDPRHKSLMETMDKLNKTYGNHKVKLGSQDPKITWRMRQEHLSPKYTTCLSDIITVNV